MKLMVFALAVCAFAQEAPRPYRAGGDLPMTPSASAATPDISRLGSFLRWVDQELRRNDLVGPDQVSPREVLLSALRDEAGCTEQEIQELQAAGGAYARRENAIFDSHRKDLFEA